MKKILLFLLIPVMLFSIEVKKKSSSTVHKSKYRTSSRVYELKKDTLDRDEDGILDKFMKKLRKKEEEKKKIENKRKIEHKKKPRYRKKLRSR
jgi:hypothetical protein